MEALENEIFENGTADSPRYLYGARIHPIEFLIGSFCEAPEKSFDDNLKESLHLIEFAILYVLLVLAFLTKKGGLTPSWNVACALFAGLYGVSDEIHQSFNPARSASVFDLVKDFTGIAVCYYFIRGALFKARFARLGKLLEGVKTIGD